jgi:hypothetical protein
VALYCKVDSCLDSNPKIRKAGRAGREVYLFLLRRNRVLDANGVLPIANIDPAYLADQLMMPGNDAVTAVTACVTAGLITVNDQNATIAGWSEEWSREPMSNAERQAAYKLRQKEAKVLAEAKPAEVTAGNGADVTGNGSNVREEKRREEKISEGAKAPPPPRSKARHRLPADWAPSARHQAQAVGLRLEIGAQAESFRLHASATGRVMADWDAAFAMWLTKAHGYGGAKPSPAPRLDLGPAYVRDFGE